MSDEIKRAWVKDDLAIFNERTKLKASALNIASVSFIGVSVLKPVFEGTVSDWSVAILCLILGLIIHKFGGYILEDLRREED